MWKTSLVPRGWLRGPLRTWIRATFTPTGTGKVGQPPEADAQVKAPPVDYHPHHAFSKFLFGLLLPNNDGIFPSVCRRWCSGSHGLWCPGPSDEISREGRVAGLCPLAQIHNLSLGSKKWITFTLTISLVIIKYRISFLNNVELYYDFLSKHFYMKLPLE